MSDLYRLCGTEVRAFKVNFIDTYPHWFKKGIEKGTVYYQGGKYPYYTIEDGSYIERAGEGDYVILNGDSLRVVRKEFFERYYEKLAN